MLFHPEINGVMGRLERPLGFLSQLLLTWRNQVPSNWIEQWSVGPLWLFTGKTGIIMNPGQWRKTWLFRVYRGWNKPGSIWFYGFAVYRDEIQPRSYSGIIIGRHEDQGSWTNQHDSWHLMNPCYFVGCFVTVPHWNQKKRHLGTPIGGCVMWIEKWSRFSFGILT